jgi:hypothetical protein
MANARAIAFTKLAKLFNDLNDLTMVIPANEITKEQTETAGQLLKEKFTEIMDEYDRLHFERISHE